MQPSKSLHPVMASSKSWPPVVYLIGVIAVGFGLLMGKNLLERSTRDHLANRRSLGAIAFSPVNASDSFKRGNQSFQAGAYTEAHQHFNDAIAQMSDNPMPRIYAQNAQSIPKPHLKIAAVVPLGSNRNVALEMLRGVAIAQEQFNQQGHSVVVEIFNDDNDPDIARQVATTIVNDPSIKAVVGPNASNAALVAAPIYEEAGVVMITPTSFDTAIAGLGPHIYRTTPNIRHLVYTLVNYSVQQARRKKIAVCYDADAADNLAFKEEFVNALLEQGGQYIPTDCNFSSPRFDAQQMVTQLISDGADAVLLTPHIDRLDRLIDLSKANRWRMVLLGSPSLETRKILDIGQGDLNGVVIPVPYHQDMPQARAFVALTRQKFQVSPTWRTFASWDAMTAILTDSQPSNSRGEIQSRLQRPDFQVPGTAEPIRFLPSGDRVGNGVLVQIRPKARGYHFAMIAQP